MAQDVHVNMDQVLCLSHMFHLMLGAGRAALLPFLALYLRLLGLSATQTGLVFGARAFMTMICAPAWTSCAKRFNKKKLVLVLSLFMMLLTHMAICLIPPSDQHIPFHFCKLGFKNHSKVTGMVFPNSTTTTGKMLVSSTTAGNTSFNTKTATEHYIVNNGTEQNNAVIEDSGVNNMQDNVHPTVNKNTTYTTVSMISATTIQKRNETLDDDYWDPKYFDVDSDLFEDTKSSSVKKSGVELTKEEEDFFRTFHYTHEQLEHLSSQKLAELLNQITTGEKPRTRRSLMDSVIKKLQEFQNNFHQADYQAFIFILLLFVVGELFAAPYEKLSDDVWFEYLDILDLLKRYGGHRIWRTVGFVIVPPIVTLIVDNTPCTLSYGINHFFVHFVVFALFLSLAVILALCYPVSQLKQTAKKSRLGKGVRLLCGDRRSYSMAMTMVVVGISSAVISNFLFWRVQDLGGPELAMGISVAAAGVAEFLMRLVGPSLMRRLEPVWAMSLALLLLAGLLVFYSFLWSPWLVVVGELVHGTALTLIWIALQRYPEFRINPFVMDRSAVSLVSALNVGVGFAAGSMVSGIVYDKLGMAILFQGTAGMIGMWVIAFLLAQLIGKKEKIRYAKLLQDSEDDDSDTSPVYEDDWLEVAMKRDR